MAVAAEPSASWLKTRNDFLSSLLKKEEVIALPPFPKAQCLKHLHEKFRLEDANLTMQSCGVLTADQVARDFGRRVLVQPLTAHPLEQGDFLFITSEEDIQLFMQAVFNDSSLASYFYEKDKLLGFHYYFAAELCKLFQDLAWLPGLSVRVAGDASFSTRSLQGSYHAVDICCSLDGKQVRMRMLFPEGICDSYQKFVNASEQEIDVQQLAGTSLTLSLDVGYCSLSQEEWKQVVPGSFILLDSCLYDPDTGESGGFLSIQEKQFFGGRFMNVTSGEFKITSFPTLHQEAAQEQEESQSTEASQASGSKLVAEVARYSLAIEEFMNLAQGSVLNLDGVHPSHGVNLILNGTKVGKGEIISLGDVLGIRVLEV